MINAITASNPVRLTGLLAALLFLGACAQSPKQQGERTASTRVCPAGTTMMCEAASIGRIRHGTFARANSKCGCVPDGARTLDSPVIPSAH